MTTIDLRPAPAYVRTAIAHAGLPIVYNDDHTGSIADTPTLLSAAVGLALTKHATDTMVLPSNVNGIREVAQTLRTVVGEDPEAQEIINEQIERLVGLADNLDGLVADSGALAPAGDVDDLQSEIEVLRKDFEGVEENLRERIREVERNMVDVDDFSRVQERVEEIDGKVDDLERDVLALSPDDDEADAS